MAREPYLDHAWFAWVLRVRVYEERRLCHEKCHKRGHIVHQLPQGLLGYQAQEMGDTEKKVNATWRTDLKQGFRLLAGGVPARQKDKLKCPKASFNVHG